MKSFILYLIILALLTIFLIIFSLKFKEKFGTKKKYAVCVWGQLRGVQTTIESFNKNLCIPLNADLFIFGQKTNTNTDLNLELYKNNIIVKELYQNPENIKQFYIFECDNDKNYNFCDERHLKIYYNWYKISQKFGDILQNNYEYIILTRSDFLHLFPFPDILSISQRKDVFWCYDGHEWGGVNATLICIPSIYIKEYLSIFYNYMNNPENKAQDLIFKNVEEYLKIVFDYKKWIIGKMNNTSLIIADNENEITTTHKPSYNAEHNIYYKYDSQLIDSYKSLDIYNNGGKWKYIMKDNTPYLLLE